MAGFKSFAEAAEIDIESGLTGIVGPNGCGKSNIVEGLRWVMGESSARQMRGGEMDDVIFSGTEQRPARNLAEITLELDNRKRSAPAEYNSDDIEITVKLSAAKAVAIMSMPNQPAPATYSCCLLMWPVARGHQALSVRANGAIVGRNQPIAGHFLKKPRIFAPACTAARGRIAIAERRKQLERLDDVIAGLIEQRDSLKKQARQAARYRSLPIASARPKPSCYWQAGAPPPPN